MRRETVEGAASLPRGPIFKAYLVYAAVLLLTELHGLGSGGDFKVSLWELRPQGYGFVMFLLAGSLVRNRRQALVLGIVLLSAVALKALVGTYRWQFTLNRVVPGETVLGHEDSYFMILFVLGLLAALVWARRIRVVTPLLVAAPVVLILLFANQRRAGVFAFAAAVLVTALMLLKFEPAIRKQLLVLLVVATVSVGVFVGANWNREYGLSAQLVRPVRSLVDPTANARDDSSDLYRIAEDYNLKFTFKESPLIGRGFGLPFDTPAAMANISNYYSLWNVIPHNSMLWIPMRMGVLGMVAFWGLIATAILEAFAILRRHQDPVARAIAVFAVGAIVAELLVGYGDLQLESYRNLVFIGVLLGVLARIRSLPEVDQE
jgi:hypothetical protein